MNTKSIIIYGASGFGRELAWLAEVCQAKVVCFVDDDLAKQGKDLNGIPVMALVDAGEKFPEAAVVVAVGNPKIREHLAAKVMKTGFGFKTLIHPRTELSRWIETGEGTVICAGCILTTNIILGKHVQINLNCTIGHDVVMDDYATLAPGAHISGHVHLGERVYVGTGAVLINGTEEQPVVIGDDAVIGAGACVTKSIPQGETWGGVPARPLHQSKPL